jgi:uncharacterized protein (DUF427 family)
VWDYPRPPALEQVDRTVTVDVDGVRIATTDRPFRVLETSHPPTYYLPAGSISAGVLVEAGGGSVCEWKGQARYWDVVAGDRTLPRAAWSYPAPTAPFMAIAGHVSFYPSMVECHVEGVRVEPQAGGFYGGWITPEIVGPFKGEPGTMLW